VDDIMSNDKDSVEILEVAGCIVKSMKDGGATIECGEGIVNVAISRDDIKILKGISDIATDDE